MMWKNKLVQRSSRGIRRGGYEGHEAECGGEASGLSSVEVEVGIDKR